MKLHLYDNEKNPSFGFKLIQWVKAILTFAFVILLFGMAGWAWYDMTSNDNPSTKQQNYNDSDDYYDDCIPDPWGVC